jgi:hypothetical protein
VFFKKERATYFPASAGKQAASISSVDSGITVLPYAFAQRQSILIPTV